jgi:hypothetical protein
MHQFRFAPRVRANRTDDCFSIMAPTNRLMVVYASATKLLLNLDDPQSGL